MAAIGLCFAVVSTTPVAAPAAPVAGACETTGTKVKVSTTYQSTASTAYVNVIEIAIPFTQRRTGCVIVSFSSLAYADPNYTMYVSAAVDGFGCAPYDFLFAQSNASGSPITVRAMNFLCRDVAGPGNHTVKMLFKSDGGLVALRDRTMIVHYVK